MCTYTFVWVHSNIHKEGIFRVTFLLSLLLCSGRIPEAAFLARTYVPSRVSDVVALWKTDLKTINQKAAESLADPKEYPNMFPNWDLALLAEEKEKGSR